MVLAISLLLLAASPDAGTALPDAGIASPDAGVVAPLPATDSGERVAIIWGGGKDAAAAKEWLERWHFERKQIPPRDVFLMPGFPKIVSSATVPGLNPGFEIVLLGFCRPGEHQTARKYLKALHPFIYEKPVTMETTNACPMLGSPYYDLHSVAEPQTTRAGDITLTVSTVSVKPILDPSAQRESVVGWVDVLARDAKGTLLDVYSLEDKKKYDGVTGQTIGCETSVEAVRKGAAVLHRTCTWAPGKGCVRHSGEKTRVTVSWYDKALLVGADLLKQWSADPKRDCSE